MKSHRATWAVLSCAAALVLCLSDSRAQIGGSSPQPASDKAAARAKLPARFTTKPIWISESHDRALAALRTKVDVNFDKTPLAEVAEWASKIADIPVRVDREAIEEAGIDPASVTTLKLRGVTLRNALRYALLDLDLTVDSRDGGLRITTADAAAYNLVLRAYPVADLMSKPGTSDSSTSDEMLDLCELVTCCVSATSWNDVGGIGSITDHGDVLFVRQPIRVHEEVESFLASLREVVSRQRTGDFTPVSLFPDSSETVHKALDTLVDLEVEEKPLDEFARQISKQFDFNVNLDAKAFEDIGVALDTPLSGKFKQVSLRHVLVTLLRDPELHFLARDNILLITTPSCYRERMAIYPVRDLMDGNDPIATEAKDDRIIHMVHTTIAPQSWDVNGGRGSVRFDAPWHAMTFNATSEVHEQIAALIAAMRKAQVPSDAPPQSDAAMTLKVYKLPQVEDAQLAKETAEAIAITIRDLVEPHSWRPGAEGGPFVKALPDRLVVRHNAAAQKEVRRLLRMLESPEDVTDSAEKARQKGPFVTSPIPAIGDNGK